jgi:hypothetical protein
MNDLSPAPRIPVVFPPAPQQDDEFTASNGVVYRFDGVVWVIVGGGGGGVPPGVFILKGGDSDIGLLQWNNPGLDGRAIDITNGSIHVSGAGVRVLAGEVQSPLFVAVGDPAGYAFGTPAQQNGGIYKKFQAGVTIREDADGHKTALESNDGADQWEIVDARGGAIRRQGVNRGLDFTDDDETENYTSLYQDSVGNFIIRKGNPGFAPATVARTRPGAPNAFLEILATPDQPLDAVNKAYVDQVVTGTPTVIGAVDASTGLCRLLVGTDVPIPPAANYPVGSYMICVVAGTIPDGEAANITMAVGDWLITDGAFWHDLAVGNPGVATTADQVALIPTVFGEADVQAGMEAAEGMISSLVTRDSDLEDRVTVVEGDVSTKIDQAGGTMQGQLFLRQAQPAGDWEAAPKSYVDNSIGGIVPQPPPDLTPYALDDEVVHLAGDTMTGLLTLRPVLPQGQWDATPKAYVDNLFTGGGQRMLIGTINATTGACMYTTASGLTNGPLVAASLVAVGSDIICNTTGTIPGGPANGITMQVGDFLISDGADWIYIALPHIPTTASQVALVPNVFGADNVQDGLQAAAGQVLPPGGAAGQVLGKITVADYAASWIDPPPTGITDNTFYFLYRTSGAQGMNSFTMMGAYNIPGDNLWTTANKPPMGINGGNAGTNQLILHVFRSSLYIVQEAYEIPIGTGTNPLTIYTKWMRSADANFANSTGWTAWVRQSMAFQDLSVYATILYVDTQDALKVSKAGDVMAGFLSLNADPTANMHAANKAYVDFNDGLKVSKVGDTMTGDLILPGTPVNPLGAVTRQYVDNIVASATVLVGAIDGSTGNCTFIDGSTGPVPAPNRPGEYLVCVNPGTIPSGPATGVVMLRGDWLYDNGTIWFRIAVGSTGVTTTADQVAVIPSINGASNVQAGLAAMVGKAGGATNAMTSFLSMGTNTAQGAPTLNARSVGTRIVIRDHLSATLVDHALGVMTGGAWWSVPQATDSFRFYCGTTERYRFENGGLYVLGGAVANPIRFWAATPAVAPPAANNATSNGTRIQLYGANDAFAIGIESGNMWYCASAATNGHKFYNGNTNLACTIGGAANVALNANNKFITNVANPGSSATDAANKGYVDARVAKTGDTMTGELGMDRPSNARGIWLRKTNRDQNTACPSLSWWNTKSGNNGEMGRINQYQKTQWYAYQDYSYMSFFCGDGIMRETARGEGTSWRVLGGTCFANAFTQNSDARRKMDIATADEKEAVAAFDKLKPMRFRWKPGEIDDPLSITGKSQHPHPDPLRLQWGFVAQDVEAAAPDLVTTHEEHGKSFDLGGLVAVMAAKIKSLEARLAEAGL